jgi:hypothetical protein
MMPLVMARAMVRGFIGGSFRGVAFQRDRPYIGIKCSRGEGHSSKFLKFKTFKFQEDSQVPSGGARPGAGRPKGSGGRIKGSISKSTRAIIEAAQAGSVMPLEVMLYNMRRHWDAKAYDLAASCAEKAAPYLHPRLAASTVTMRPSPSDMTDAELAQWIADAKAAAGIAGGDRGSGDTAGRTKH